MFVSFSIIVYGYLIAAIIKNTFKMIISLSRFILQRLQLQRCYNDWKLQFCGRLLNVPLNEDLG